MIFLGLPRVNAFRRHLWLHAYRASFLRSYRSLTPAPHETTGMLEQLRALWHGSKIHVADAVAQPGPGVDVEADAERVVDLLQKINAVNT